MLLSVEDSHQRKLKQEGKTQPNSKRTGEDDQEWNDLKIVSRELRRARKERRNLENQAKEELKEHKKRNFVENLPSSSDPEKSKGQRQAIEKRKRQFRQIIESLRKRSIGCIAHIVVHEPEMEYPYKLVGMKELSEVYALKEVGEDLLNRSREHFSQAERTRFTTKEI